VTDDGYRPLSPATFAALRGHLPKPLPYCHLCGQDLDGCICPVEALAEPRCTECLETIDDLGDCRCNLPVPPPVVPRFDGIPF